MRKCQSCHGDINTKRMYVVFYVNGVKKYGCAPCCDSGAFDTWLDAQPDETKPCSPHANGPSGEVRREEGTDNWKI